MPARRRHASRDLALARRAALVGARLGLRHFRRAGALAGAGGGR